MHVVLKAPCKNDAGFTGSLVACSGLASAARQGTRSSVCVWLADMGIVRCRTGARRCSDFSADSSPTSVKKGRYFPFPSATPSSRRNVYIQRLWHIFRKRWISVSAAIRKKSYKTRIVLEMRHWNRSSGKYIEKMFIVIGNLWKLSRNVLIFFFYISFNYLIFLTKIDFIVIYSFSIL